MSWKKIVKFKNNFCVGYAIQINNKDFIWDNLNFILLSETVNNLIK